MTRATVTPSTWEWLADVTERLADLLDGCDLSDLPEQVRERLALGRAHMYATAAVMDAAAEHLDKTGPRSAQVDDDKIMRRTT